MEQIQKKRSMSEVVTRKGVTQLRLVLSVSVFSFLFSYYYYYDYYCSVLSSYVDLVYPIELLLTQSMDKRYMFLICNGILVVLVKTSGSLISQSSFDLKEHIYIKNIHDALQTHYTDDMVEDEELVIRVDGNEEDVKFVMENVGETIEELNKKFDEFIRKRKEEIRSDAD
ncbi:hypothetical protein L1987_19879 [Smallanthus sonchifolius]|uniref:Uncharacterized protein n=1 Tax=Smallanthus sonchifolius TaxID=185202 RepID=A0ACB9IRI2_9ASTR|nr:hypothetical protein L1987_19879 [Smallanthus sonchifolius]